MSTTQPSVAARPWHPLREAVRATVWIGARQIRNTLREPAGYIPAFVIPLFFYFVQSGSLSGFAERSGVSNYEAFVLPVAILFATSNEGAGFTMVLDIERGYFDKLLLTPASRLSLVLGAMGANFARVVMQATIVVAIALLTGVEFATGIVGAVLMILMASLWGIAFAGLGMGVALKTGNEQATQGAQTVIFPMIFLSTTFAPKEAMTGWLKTAVSYNPVTYLLEGMRTFSLRGWEFAGIAKGLVAVAAMAAVSVSFSFWALRKRAS